MPPKHIGMIHSLQQIPKTEFTGISASLSNTNKPVGFSVSAAKYSGLFEPSVCFLVLAFFLLFNRLWPSQSVLPHMSLSKRPFGFICPPLLWHGEPSQAVVIASKWFSGLGTDPHPWEPLPQCESSRVQVFTGDRTLRGIQGPQSHSVKGWPTMKPPPFVWASSSFRLCPPQVWECRCLSAGV